jgi:hypothetical protein
MILIRQSELNAAGFRGDFPSSDMRTQRNWASIVCRNRGDNDQAFMLEMNNVLAISKITYVNDTY